MTDVSAHRLKIALVSRYVIERTLGQGGMATVYLARDLRHERRVALKVLRPELAAAIGADRFLNEIRVTASLQHPHILPLHDSGETDGFLYYVMPYVEGESLRDRLNGERQLPVDDAIRIATEVAAALAYAHGKGVIHRDVKPENILLASGAAVVADFGIARAVTAAGGGRLTQTGLSLGTPHYMSPEQATAERDVDARTDIYALATVVYEMLVGEPPFAGPTAQSVIAKVLTENPRSMRLGRPTVPEHIDAAVRKALAKLPADRFRTATEFSTALTRPALTPEYSPATSASTAKGGLSPKHRQLVLAAAVLVGLLAFGISGWLREPPPRPEPIVRSTITLPNEAPADARQFGSSLALSPDGSVLVYAANQQLFVRRLDQIDAVPIPNTSAAEQPFFSPDGRHIGFVANGVLKRVPLAGGPVLTIGAVQQIQGATWGDNDIIVFSRALGTGGSLFKISAAGGTPELVIADSTGSNAFRWPSFLPGRDKVLVSIGTGLSFQTGLVDLETGRLQSIPGAGASAHFVEPNWLLSVAVDGTVIAVPFDAQAGRATGPAMPVPVLDRVATGLLGSAKLAVSRNGWAVYMEGFARRRRLTLVDRRGARSTIATEAQPYSDPRFSANGKDVAVTVIQPGGGLAGDIWVLNVARATMSRLTFDGANEYPDWSADGRRVLYTTVRGENGLYSRAAGGGTAESLFKGPGQQMFEAILTHDEKRVVYRLRAIPADLYHVHRDSIDKSHALLESPYDERSPVISPDDRWLAYVSNETGRDEVYVRPFPDDGARSMISAAGGTEPRWSRDGRELFYRNADTLFAVEVKAQQTFTADKRVPLFVGTFLQNTRHATYDVHPDGQHFIFVTDDANDFGELMLVQNVMAVATRSPTAPANR
ncbi:MAG TPA: protein kinase [Gemmatimonadaceae bacterium]|nr:protein kinase [Gemmatimonadaceae bacterium]